MVNRLAVELPPKDLTVVSLYFDVPADADLERLNTTFDFPHPKRKGIFIGWPVTFDLARSTLGDVPPTWWLALELELTNAREYDLAYRLFDSASREQSPPVSTPRGCSVTPRWW